MSEKAQINMLGRFEVIVGQERIDQRLRKSTKGWTLIKYLLLHMDEEVPFYELYEVLWPNEESSNPENALKTLISRMRSFLNTASPTLAECIVTNHGAYSWNRNLACDVDVIDFEHICKELDGAQELTDEVRAGFDKALSLYVGDLLPTNSQEAWAVSRSVTLHNLYIRTVYQYLDLLKANEAYDDVVRVCRTALEIDAFDERLHVDLMDALVKTKRNNEAMLQYKHATNMHFRYLGIQPPEGIQEFYKYIIQAGQVLDIDIDSIREELVEYDKKKGAFVCEYAVFKEIYNLQMRNLERLGTTIFIALIMVSNVDGQPMEPMKLDDIMRNLMQALVENLRKGDTITQYSASQYALLLPNVNYETGKMVLERIKQAFYKIYPNSSVACNYRLGPINERYGQPQETQPAQNK